MADHTSGETHMIDTRKLLEALSKAPESQADPSVIERCDILLARGFTAADIKSLLDDIAHCALASDVFMYALDQVWVETLRAEQRNVDATGGAS